LIESKTKPDINLESDYGPGITKKQAYLTFAIVGLALLMASIDSTIVAVSLPTMLNDLNTSLAYIGWVLTGYQFSQSIIMPIAGKLSDDLGRKRLFMIAVAVFTVSSIAAGFSPNIFWLIIFRIIQGFGGGAFLPSATGIISDTFGKRRTTFIGLFGSIFPIGGILGPILGGIIIAHLSWRWIFFVNIPIGVLLIILGSLILPKIESSNSKRKIDLVGAGLFSGAVLAILYGMTIWSNSPQSFSPVMGVLFVVGLVLLAIFVRYESRSLQPMIEVNLLKWRPFLAVNLYNFIFGAVVFGAFAFIPYYAQVAYGMTAEQTGYILTPRALTMIAMSAITSIFIIRFRYRLPMIVGILIISAGFFLLSRGFHDANILGLSLHNLVLLAFLVSLGGAGMGIANPPANNSVLDLMPEKAAAITGLRGMFRSVGGVFGTAAVVLMLSHYQDKATGMQQIFSYLGFLLLLIIPVVFMIPDFARQRRRQANNANSTDRH
jgi:EmrB/QacA subfamily drug resistance transporter